MNMQIVDEDEIEGIRIAIRDRYKQIGRLNQLLIQKGHAPEDVEDYFTIVHPPLNQRTHVGSAGEEESLR